MADRGRQPDSRRGPLIALGVVVFLFVVGWLLARQLYANAKAAQVDPARLEEFAQRIKQKWG